MSVCRTNTVIKTDAYNNVWIHRTAGGRFVVQVRLPGNEFRRLHPCRKWLAEVMFDSCVNFLNQTYAKAA